MDPRYEGYALADPDWYEPLDRRDDADSRLSLVAGELPAGWRRDTEGVWVSLAPEGPLDLPEQGWKVHVSATPGTAEETVEAVWGVCRRLGLPWKFLRSRFMVTALGSKYANRSSSGKVVTVYPRTPEQLRTVLSELDAVLGGRPGPYVLSDLRWNNGPVSVRYGAFALMWCELPDGTRVPAVRDPEGTLVPDLRRAAFTVPQWVDLPDFLAERIAASGTDGGPTLGRYRVVRALHFSNGGGVYLAEDERGHQVVLKEARPHAGLDGQGADAVARLRAEYAVLRRIGHLPFVPSAYEYFTAWEHHYLAMEYIPGETFNAWLGRENPLVRFHPDQRTRAGFARLATDRLEQLEECVETLHAAGVAFGDLHHRNIVLRPEGAVALVDFEGAGPVDAAHRPTLGAPGFMHPSIASARDADLFALGCCQLATFVPLTVLMARTPAVVRELVDIATAAFPTLPAGLLKRMNGRLALAPELRPHLPRPGAPRPQPAPTGDFRALAAAQTADLLRGIRQSATPARADRLHPGDIAGHRPGGAVGLAHGASGVLLAQQAAGDELDAGQLDWLLRAVRQAPGDTPVGLYDGLAGAAWLLHRLRHPQALAVVDRVLAGPLPASPGLYGGLTGIAQLLLDVGAKDEALDLATLVAERIGEPGALDRPGLMHGWSGPSVLFSRCAQVAGDTAWAEAAERALRHDLRHGRMVDGMLQMHSSHRLLPYLAEGTAGAALAAMALPAAQAAAVGAGRVVEAAARAAAVRFVVQGGLFNGRAGLAYFLSHASVRQPQWRTETEEQLRLLSLHLAPHRGARVLHGDQLIRLSLDLATGSAGALLALEAARNPGACLLPGAHPTPG